MSPTPIQPAPIQPAPIQPAPVPAGQPGSEAVQIRSTRVAEWAAYRDLRLLALRDAPTAFASTYAREVAFPESLWRSRIAENPPFVARRGEVFVGTATAWFISEEPDLVRLVAMFVHPAVRGQGIGGRLVDAVVADAWARGRSRVRLQVVQTNAAATALYLGRGFVPTGATALLPHTPELTEIELELARTPHS